MALVEPVKKGGRYTVKEKEERRIQVYHLHFEENKSAVKIAELLGVNRHTINDDVAYWHSQLASEFNGQNLTSKMTKQIQRIEMQRDRLLEYLDDVDSDKKLKIEKFISEIDNKLMQYFSKMILSGKTTLEPTATSEEIDDNEIKELVRGLIFEDGLEELHSENNLKFHFIRETKCDVNHAENLLGRMKNDGLVLCEQRDEKSNGYFERITCDYSKKYNLEKFVNMRGYITMDELSQILLKRSKLEAEIRKINELEEKLIQKHGAKSKWPEGLLEKFESENLDDSVLLE
ncbi:MAG: hypothetical protein O3C48_05380 [Crenarchaeota archaeon]|nr:hypothetical protein [Thermoproteota archaeon]